MLCLQLVRCGRHSEWVAKRETFVARARLTWLAILGGLLLGGCAEGSGLGGDPGPTPLAFGQTCGSVQQELNRLLGRGVQSSVERQNAGKPISPTAKADVDRYNALLNQYLGARCHV
jgi:hypothetical protein